MIYRRLPPNPPKMLLRIVATAGTGILLGAAACSSGSVAVGVVVHPSPDDTGDGSVGDPNTACGATGACSGAPFGSSGLPLGSSGAPSGSTSGGPFGVAYVPPEAGLDGDVDAALACGGGVCGSLPITPEDAGDAALTCGHGGVCGSIVMPPDAGEDGSADAGVFHGIINGIVINPGH